MSRTGWLEVAEAGGALGIRLLVIVCTMFGRAPARLILRLVAAYYTVTHRKARHASRAWLEKACGSKPIAHTMVYRHILRFCQVSLDRLFLVRGQLERFDIRVHGAEHFERIRAATQGVIFLGAHLGSFEALRVLAEGHEARINILGYFENARMIHTALQRLDPQCVARLIEIHPGRVDFVFSVQDRIDRGEHVGILGDRVGLGGATVTVDFLGAPARLPSGPYVLAAVLRCPVYLVFALHSAPNRYDVYCEPFADRIDLPRRERKTATAGYAQRFADRLGHHATSAPDNWFNFYDFWWDRGAPQRPLKPVGQSETC